MPRRFYSRLNLKTWTTPNNYPGRLWPNCQKDSQLKLAEDDASELSFPHLQNQLTSSL